jgi:beta-lactamase class A
MARTPEAIVKASKAQYSYCCTSPKGGQILKLNENRSVETASTIKLLIMAYAFQQAEKGKLNFRQPVKVTRRDVGKYGSGIMPLFYLHKPFELYNLIVLMMTVSDNVATNVLIRLLGKDNINAYGRSIGLTKTKLEMDHITFTKGYRLAKERVAVSTAKEMAMLVELIVDGKLHREYYAGTAKSLMQHVQGSRVSRRIPFTLGEDSALQFGSKTGTLVDWRGNYLLGEAGFVVDKNRRRHIFSVYGTGKLTDLSYSSDSPSIREFAELGEALFRELEKG